MTVCNMSIEAGARAGMISPDRTTFEYLRGREMGPSDHEYDEVVAEWQKLATDEGAHFDHATTVDVSELEPQVTWGTNPGMVIPISGSVPDPTEFEDSGMREVLQNY